MSLIKSISGFRGTIGGSPGNALTPIDIVEFAAAYAEELKERLPGKNSYKVVVGRDARLSGQMVDSLVCGTLVASGITVVNAGLSSTPTVEMAVVFENADGGIILTASHNPIQWNALKLLNEKGEFLNAQEGEKLLKRVEERKFKFVEVRKLGSIIHKEFTQQHIDSVLNYCLVDKENIAKAKFRVVLDAVNSVGGIIMPLLLSQLGVECICINCEATGEFAHNPEPLPENLIDLSKRVISEKADLGISVDPDVDRLALICENGEPFGEEYTIVAVADYILRNKKGATVSNLSSSRALRDITEQSGCKYYTAAVGEVNVVTEMKKQGAVIGGEGNGGVIVPDFHYGRDAMIGIALFLSNLATKKITASQLRGSYPQYVISKNKIELSANTNIDLILNEVKKIYNSESITDIDGVKVDFLKQKEWVHLRKSNTEPIIRVYAEAASEERADTLAKEVIDTINTIINK